MSRHVGSPAAALVPDPGRRPGARLTVEDRLLIVTPMRNEARHIRSVVEKMVAQERQPDVWIVVDDGSTDGTSAVLDELRLEVPFLRVVRRMDPAGADVRDRLAIGAPALAFNAGLATVAGDRFEYVGKIDGDVGLPRDYFRVLLERFAAEPSLGLAGGTILERRSSSRWRRVAVPNHHVPGALKLYRRECLDRIGGVRNMLAWDTIDEMYARLLGYRTQSYRDLAVLHYRRTGSATGVVRGKARHGACAWIVHYPPYFVVLRALKLGLTQPLVLSGLAFIYGYAKAALSGLPRVQDEAFKQHVQHELAGRLATALAGLARRP